jgi:hypothetical protein
MIFASWLATVLLALIAQTPPQPLPHRDDPPRMLTILVPAYFYPSGRGLQQWEALIAAGPKTSVVAIVNPADGPGEGVDENYMHVLDRARKAGVTLIGYVSTRYAARSREEAERDIERWGRFYPGVRGFFFDEQASGAEKLDYYAALYTKARSTFRGALVVSNPGTLCAEGYFSRPAADVVCIYENYQGFDTVTLPEWTHRYTSGRFAALPYGVEDATTMKSYVRKAVDHCFGYLYVTDNASRSNPWDRLPKYWDEEVALVRQLNAAMGRKPKEHSQAR